MWDARLYEGMSWRELGEKVEDIEEKIDALNYREQKRKKKQVWRE